MKILVTGGSGVLGRRLIPLLEKEGHEVSAPRSRELDLFASGAVERAADGAEIVYHLATHIPPPESQGDREAWGENDRLRSEATPILVDAAIAAGASRVIYPSIAFVYAEEGEVDESSPLGESIWDAARSTLDAEREVRRFAESGRGDAGVVLRLGLLYGPGTGNDEPAERFAAYGATVRIEDAGTALAAALDVPDGIYNVVRDGERVSNARFKEATNWRPEH